MSELNSLIVKELQAVERVAKASGFSGDEAGLAVLYLLRLVNAGKMRGVYAIRINGHHVGSPSLTDVKTTLDEIREKVVLKEKLPGE